MRKARIICHMVTSLDGKVTGGFLAHPACGAATEAYYALGRAYRAAGAGGFICGRVTMEESFTGGFYPDLTAYAPQPTREDFWPRSAAPTDFYAIAFDPKGRLGWRAATIADDDPGYDRARVVEVLTSSADARYLSYLRALGIPYVTAGDGEIDVAAALEALGSHIDAPTLLLEGGSVVNGYFLRAGCVDALSLVQAPICADTADKPLFAKGLPCCFSLRSAEQRPGALVLQYEREDL